MRESIRRLCDSVKYSMVKFLRFIYIKGEKKMKRLVVDIGLNLIEFLLIKSLCDEIFIKKWIKRNFTFK